MRVATRRSLISRPPVASGNWWEVAGQTCVAAYQPKGAASYALSKSNLANPGTYDAQDGGAYPTWETATGWTFNGTTQHLKAANISELAGASAMTVIARIQTNTLDAPSPYLRQIMAMESTPSTSMFVLRLETSADKFEFFTAGASFSGVSTGAISINTNYVFAGTYNGTTLTAYLNGTPQTPTTAVSSPTGSSGEQLVIGRHRADDALGNSRYWSGSMQALAIYSTALSADDVAALTTRMQSL